MFGPNKSLGRTKVWADNDCQLYTISNQGLVWYFPGWRWGVIIKIKANFYEISNLLAEKKFGPTMTVSCAAYAIKVWFSTFPGGGGWW